MITKLRRVLIAAQFHLGMPRQPGDEAGQQAADQQEVPGTANKATALRRVVLPYVGCHPAERRLGAKCVNRRHGDTLSHVRIQNFVSYFLAAKGFCPWSPP